MAMLVSGRVNGVHYKWVTGGYNTTYRGYTPWKFKSSPMKIYHPKRKGLSSDHDFSGGMLNLGGVIPFITSTRWAPTSYK